MQSIIRKERKMCLVMQKITVMVALSRSADEAMHAPPAMPGAACYCHEPYFIESAAGMLGVSHTTAYCMVSDRLIPICSAYRYERI